MYIFVYIFILDYRMFKNRLPEQMLCQIIMFLKLGDMELYYVFLLYGMSYLASKCYFTP